mmetsp:Transcript_3110/g.4463  ORF Transcript_3110/g.4463 Transcript_3110/m.4463 type:complete len:113 (-) Transcript_3110:8-346(-)
MTPVSPFTWMLGRVDCILAGKLVVSRATNGATEHATETAAATASYSYVATCATVVEDLGSWLEKKLSPGRNSDGSNSVYSLPSEKEDQSLRKLANLSLSSSPPTGCTIFEPS